MKWPLTLSLVCLLTFLSGCTSAPKGIAPIEGFELSRYLGTWHEIARLDHGFERGLSQVSAEYRLRDDGGVSVINRGYSAADKSWKVAEGKAYFVESSDIGHLKVSFFGPFYGGYNIIALDRRDYSYALVCGPNRRYLWILARTPKLNPTVLQELLHKARQFGFATDLLIYPKHDRITQSRN